MNQHRLALIGAGGISRAHLAAIKEISTRLAVVAVAEPDEKNRARAVEETGAKGFASADALFEQSAALGLEGVLVCTPPNIRVPIVEQAISKKLAVFVEKPLAHDLNDSEKLEKLAKQSGKPCVVGYCHRFTPAMIEMKRRADAGELGEVLRFENTFACWHPTMQKSWMSDKAVSGGGSFVDTGCHSLDLFRYLVGDASMTATIAHELWPGRGESNATALLRAISTANHKKCVGVIQSGWAEPARFTVALTGTSASLFYDYEHPTALKLVPIDGPARTLDVETHDVRFTRQLAAFADLLAGRDPAIRPADFTDGAKVAKLIDESNKLRQII